MRPRFSRSGRAYKHKNQALAEETILTLLAPHKPAQPYPGPVKLGVQAFLPIPRSWSRKRKEEAKPAEPPPPPEPSAEEKLLSEIRDILKSRQ